MKTARIVAIVAGVVITIAAVALAVITVNRNQLARELAGRLLARYDVAVEDVSVASIGTQVIEFETIILERGDGTQIRIDGIALPISAAGLAGQSVSIRRVEVVPSTAGTGRADIAGTLDLVVELPLTLPGTSVTVEFLAVRGYPEASDVRWQTRDDLQSLRAVVADHVIELELTTADDARSSALATLAHVDAGRAATVDATLRRVESGYEVKGRAALSLAPLSPALLAAGILPASVTELAADLAGDWQTAIADNTADAVELTAAFELADGLNVRHVRENGDALEATIGAAVPVATQFSYPSLDWRADVASLSLLVTAGVAPAIPATLEDVACVRGTRCDFRAVADDISPATFGFESGRISARAERISIETGDEVSAAVRNLDVDIIGLSDLPGVELNLPLSFDVVEIRDSGAMANGTVFLRHDDARLAAFDYELLVPAARGSFTIDRDRLSAELSLGTPGGTASATATLAYTPGGASVEFDRAELDFSRGALSTLLRDWPHAWDIVAGTWSTTASLHWHADDGLRLRSSHVLSDVAARYADLAMGGFASSFDVDLSPSKPLPPLELSIAIDYVDIGFALDDLEIEMALDPLRGRADVRAASVRALGGRITADPFSLEAGGTRHEIVLRPDGVQLQLMTDLAKLESLEVSGSVSGVIPVVLDQAGVSIESGSLIGDPSGGAIRYPVSGCTDEVMRARSGFQYARCVLTDYEYDSLESTVDYSPDGQLVLGVRMTGVNPKYDPEQPVNLNPTLATNVIDLLKSLQAARDIEEILGRELTQ